MSKKIIFWLITFFVYVIANCYAFALLGLSQREASPYVTIGYAILLLGIMVYVVPSITIRIIREIVIDEELNKIFQFGV